MLLTNYKISNDKITYDGDYRLTEIVRQSTQVFLENNEQIIRPVEQRIAFKTDTRVPKLGFMFVGLSGNNGTTITAGMLANKLGVTWETREGLKQPDFYGSLSQSTVVRVGELPSGEGIFIPFKDIAAVADPRDVVIGGWDISGKNLYEGAKDAHVLEPSLREALKEELSAITPLPGYYSRDFIAPNQEARATNVLPLTMNKRAVVDKLKADIAGFKQQHGLDKVVVLWTATTERFAKIIEGVNDTWENLDKALAADHPEIAPSTLYAVAALEAGCPWINGSPQNTNVPGVIDLAERTEGAVIGGDDFKSGQTKMKSLMVEFLCDAGIKPTCIASYNHLGNNDGYNLSNDAQFKSKEITKTHVIDDMVSDNEILFPKDSTCCPNSKAKVDHTVVIKYLPYVGDSKRAMDEYTSEIFLKGKNTIVMHNTCEDSLLAAPLIMDLCLFAEMYSRVQYSVNGGKFKYFHPVCAILSYFTKAPLAPCGNKNKVINAISKQRMLLENFCRAISGLPVEDHFMIEKLCTEFDAEA